MSTPDVDTPTTGAGPRTTYREAHPIYREAGWIGPLPLPGGEKWPPPEGWTGWHGQYPSYADSDAWCDARDYGDTRQLGLRMADDVIGIDVDHYGEKRGGDTLAEACRRWGPLPPAPSSSARGDGVSAIYFYRVPRGTVLRTVIAFRNVNTDGQAADLGGIEIIQRHHRYAVAWPSTNPHADGAPYAWRDTDGPEVPPQVDQLPELPAAWIEALRSHGEPGAAEADPGTVAAFSRDHGGGDRSASLKGPLAIFERDVAGGTARHDAMVNSACMAAREARAGAYPAAEARRWLRDAFVSALAEARAGQRLVAPAEARREFESIWGWAVGQALAMTVEQCRARIKRQDPTSPAPDTSVTGAGDDTTSEQLDAYAFELAGEIRKERLRRDARAVLAAEGREPLRALRGAEFLDAPMPDYLVSRMLYRDGLAVVFGAPGAAKSFLVLDVALSLATGTPWRGRGIGRGRVHYVMAEGQSTNVLRTRAWLHHRGVEAAELADTWTVIPQAVMLTEPGAAEYLALVAQERPDLIVLDTKNLMFVGKESQGDDYGAMLRVLHSLRVAAGGASVVLIDHSGLGDDSRVRGSNAQKGGVETEIRVVHDEQGLRQVEVTRDKSGAEGASWAFRLVQVPEVARPPDVDPPAVCVPVEADEIERHAAALRASCWDVPRAALPDRVAELGGADGDAAADLFRLLVYVDPADGIAFSSLYTHLRESPRPHSRSAAHRAVGLLDAAGVLVAGSTSKSWVLAPAYKDWTTDEG